MDSTWKGLYTIVQKIEKRRYQLKSEKENILKQLYKGILLSIMPLLEATNRVNFLC